MLPNIYAWNYTNFYCANFKARSQTDIFKKLISYNVNLLLKILQYHPISTQRQNIVSDVLVSYSCCKITNFSYLNHH